MVVAIFAMRAGLRDARENRPPYLWSIFTQTAGRRDLLRQGFADVGKVFVVAIALDVTYELIVFRWVYPGQAVIVAATPAFIHTGYAVPSPGLRVALSVHSRKQRRRHEHD